MRRLSIRKKSLSWELQDLFNACLRYGTFPETWKEGSIRVLLKEKSRQGRIGSGFILPDLSPFSDWKVSGEIAGRKTQTVVFGQSVRGHEPIRISKGKMDDRRNPRNEENGKGQVCPRHLIWHQLFFYNSFFSFHICFFPIILIMYYFNVIYIIWGFIF